MMHPLSFPGGLPVLSLVIFAPLVAAVVLAFLPGGRLARVWTLMATVFIAIGSLALAAGFDSSTAGYQFVEHRPWIESLHMHYFLGVDGVSVPLILLTTLMTPLCVLASWRAVSLRVKEFMIALLVMESAMVGVFSALDFVLFFVFWEAMLIPMSLMIGVWGGPRRVYAALKFFIYTMAGSVFLLVAIVALHFWDPQHPTFSIPELVGRPYGTEFQLWVFAAFFVSFAIKVPMFPFHTWLPSAHVEAPTAGSVILASVLLKMGAYGFLRFCLPITPVASIQASVVVQWLSIAAILYGGFAALGQSDLKKLVAYSSISHMGFATWGIFSLTTDGMRGGALVLLNHGITTGALFICVGAIYERLHTRELAACAGLGRSMPALAGLLGIFCLSSMAFPGTNSFIGEFLVMSGGFSVSQLSIVAVVPGVVAAAAYNLRLLQKFAYGGVDNPDHGGVPGLRLAEMVALVPLALLVVWIGLAPGLLVEMMAPSLDNLLQQTQAALASAAVHP